MARRQAHRRALYHELRGMGRLICREASLHAGYRGDQKMRRNMWLAVLIGAAVTISTNQTFAQSPEQAPARQQAVQATRYGTALGLPRDGGKLYLPDEAYPRF